MLRNEEMMNCKKGDLAVSVISSPLYGRFCTVLRRAEVGDTDSVNCICIKNDFMGAAWHVEFHNAPEFRFVMFYDRYLRPIRDSDDEDEMLRLVGRPVGAPQAA
jgi:hypothetical protein